MRAEADMTPEQRAANKEEIKRRIELLGQQMKAMADNGLLSLNVAGGGSANPQGRRVGVINHRRPGIT